MNIKWTLTEVLRELGEVAATATLDSINRDRILRCQKRLLDLKREV